MDTLYVLCRSVDHRYVPPLDSTDVDGAFTQKQAYFLAEAQENPLVQEILSGGAVTFDGLAKADRHQFLAGPATFFRTHEILRKTRTANLPITIGRHEYPHDAVAAMFDRCVPNSKLEQVPWCSIARYRVTLGLAWGATVLTAHVTARGNESDVLLDPFVVYYMGITTTIAALAFPTVKLNRDVRSSAPWNTALYLDLNADLVRRSSRMVAAARKEFIPRQPLFKTPEFYYAIARKIEAHGFDAELQAKLSSRDASSSQLRAAPSV